MITDAILGFLGQAVRTIFGLVPQWEPDTAGFAVGGQSIGAMGASASGWFPLTTLAVCLALIFGFKVFLLGWRVVVFVYHQIWGSD